MAAAVTDYAQILTIHSSVSKQGISKIVKNIVANGRRQD